MSVLRKLVLVTDVPTPYRNFTYQRMTDLLPEFGILPSFWFMATGDRRRRDKFSDKDLDYPHRWFCGVKPYAFGVVWYLSPPLLAALARSRIDLLIVGGWSSPNHLFAPFVAHRVLFKLLWTEGNVDSMRRTSGIAPKVKRAIIEKYDGYIVAQERTRLLLNELCPPARDKPSIRFPNLVDSNVFRDGVAQTRRVRSSIRQTYGIPDDVQLWFCPARLSAEKGLGEFLPLLDGVMGVLLVIAGDGPLRHELEQTIRKLQVPVVLVGNKSQGEIVKLYAATDVFVLPSLWDSSPLSAIEACAAGLPLLLSEKVGNVADVLVDGENGWAFAPADHVGAAPLLRKIASLPRATLEAMGAKSRERYDAKFDSDRCIRDLGAEMASLLERSTRNRNA